ncbi:casein kinase 1, epsilon, partial [Pisolithus microcarpus]
NILSGGAVVTKLQHLELGHASKHKYHIQEALAGGSGIPPVQWFRMDWGTEVLVMDQLGLSLEDILSRNCSVCSNVFSIKVIAQITSQTISILEFIHSCNFIHHNVKPSHLLCSPGMK